jgi:hypothetical protein
LAHPRFRLPKKLNNLSPALIAATALAQQEIM